METSIELKSLLGGHKLSGVDMINRQIEKYGSMEDCNVINFVLDGKTYTAIEDPSDGYRSSMEKIFISDDKVINNFKPIAVVAIEKPCTYCENDVVQFFDCKTGKLVLEVGTENVDDYYPSFVANFNPENMILNSNPPTKGE